MFSSSGETFEMRGDYIKALLLSLWLWLPSLAALGTDQVQGAPAAFSVTLFSLLLLLAPLVLLARLRTYFLVLSPFALLVAPYCYLTLLYHSVPGDALISASIHSNFSLTLQVLRSVGWIVLLVPLALIAYVFMACSIAPTCRLSSETRMRLLAGLLMYAMVAMVSRVFLAHRVNLPPLFEYSTASLAYPSGLALSLQRIYNKHGELENFVSVAGRSEIGNEALLVVQVLGESLRSDHLSINGYTRSTTPFLTSLGNELLSFPDVASTANWTDGAIPALTSWPVGEASASIVQTFREAGFRTAWLSNQNGYAPANGADVLEYGVDSQDFHMRTDVNLLPMFTSFVRQAGQRQYVVLHMHGSHIPYEDRYDAASRKFVPTLRDLGIDTPLPADRQAAINSYDNTVVETDRFLASVIGELRKEIRPAILVFTSDHGENLFDDQRHLFMHTQRGPTRADIHVPLLIWMNPAYRQRFPDIAAALEANRTRKISHLQMFPTMLDIGGVTWDGRDARRSFASFRYEETSRTVQVDLKEKTVYETLR
jgi:glucan phosphoethanolaminetransferase (alkaline phosphatase superfamily)